MFISIEALNYRCFRYVKQDMNNLHILIGPNASGKSTFLDIILFLRDMVNNGPEEAIRTRVTDYRDLFWFKKGTHFELAVELEIPADLIGLLENQNHRYCRYEVSMGELGKGGESGIISETLSIFETKEVRGESKIPLLFKEMDIPETIIHSGRIQTRKKLINKVSGGNDNFYSETGRWDHSFRLGPHKSALANVPEDVDKFPVSIWFKETVLSGIQRLMLNSLKMREPSPPGMPVGFRPDGSNLPLIIERLKNESRTTYSEWLEHVRTSLSDIKDIGIIERPEDRHKYIELEYKNGLKIPSWVISDGTLRILALTLLAYIPEMKNIYLIEEPENGIHPGGIETIFQSLSSIYSGQVLLATHSPIILGLAEPYQLLCFSKQSDGKIDIINGTEHPNLQDWKKEINLGDMFASGILG